MSLAVELAELPQLFLVFSPLWFLLFLVSSGLMIWHLDQNRGGWATVTAGLTIAVMVLLGEQQFPGWVYNHPKHFLAVIGAYFAAGAVWGVIKWYLFVNKRRAKYDDTKATWLQNKGFTDPSQAKEIPDNLKADWKRFLEQERDSHGKHEWCVVVQEFVPESQRSYRDSKYIERTVLRVKPFVREHKARVASWMTYWPWSLCWALLDDFVHHAFRVIQQHLSEWMDKIAARVFKGTEKDFDVTPPTQNSGVISPTGSPTDPHRLPVADK